MLAIRLEKALENEIAKLAAAKGSSKSAVVREAVVRYLEDLEDVALVTRARKVRGRGRSIAELRRALGLEG
ncbi:MAG TPA: ribbon-helix-helix protein, CopG family [Burkholderiales bacterium]|nr:ribbon-helix-helix protein, CopG family [Burkholderiales bacterium]